MTTPWYIAVEPFDPRFGETWTNYVAWSGLTQLVEVVSLDGSLCPPVIRNPREECRGVLSDIRFEFKGYDLLGQANSALTNCGGFPLAFQNEELSSSGLIPTFARAREIQASLRDNYPDSSDSDCDIWALWKMRAEKEA